MLTTATFGYYALIRQDNIWSSAAQGSKPVRTACKLRLVPMQCTSLVMFLASVDGDIMD